MASPVATEGRTIVFFNTHHQGHVAPTLSLARKFTAAGHRVVYFVPAEGAHFLDGTDAEVRHYKDDPAWTLKQSAIDTVTNTLGMPSAVDHLMRNEFLIVQILPATLDVLPFCIEQLKRIQPGLVVYDAACTWAKLAAREVGIAAVSSCSSTLMGREERAGAFALNTERPEQQQAAKVLQESFGIAYDPVDVYCNYDDMTIVWSLPELQAHSAGFPFAKFFGTSLVPKAADTGDFPLGRLDAAKADGRRVVLFSMGTVVGQEGWNVDVQPLLDRVLAHFGGRKEYFFVMSVGVRKSVEGVLGGRPCPDNFILYQRVPQVPVLKKCDVFITHGGNNSFNESLFTGTPMLVIPVFGDQNMNAATVVRLGVGAAIDSPFAPAAAESLDHATGEAIEAKLNGIIGDEAVKGKAEQMRAAIAAMQAYYDADAVADLLKYADNLKVTIESGHYESAAAAEPDGIAMSGSASFSPKRSQQQ